MLCYNNSFFFTIYIRCAIKNKIAFCCTSLNNKNKQTIEDLLFPKFKPGKICSKILDFNVG